MGYTAWKKVADLNWENYKDILDEPAPKQPDKFVGETGTQLEKDALSFIREDCEELRFDLNRLECTDRDGRSVKPNQIPYNMERDTERLCLERAIHNFMQTGIAADAFNIYFCYLEMFVDRYGKSKKIIEKLAEFEMNAGTLLMKHRDHYSHSAYVFILGLSIFHNYAPFRESYKINCMKNEQATDKEASHHFLKYWGMTSLFHDIGYPFELPFEQIKTYFDDSIGGRPFISYKGTDSYAKISNEEKGRVQKLYNTDYDFKTVTDVLAYNICMHLGEDYGWSVNDIKEKLLDPKPKFPEQFGGFMDHAYFSGVMLYKKLFEVIGFKIFDESYMDVLSAITLHNSLFKFGITNIKRPHRKLKIDDHPLAYLLMLCDELQCWDRISYGQNSRQQVHAMWFDIKFEESKMLCTYYFDQRMLKRIENKSVKGTYPKMKEAYHPDSSDCYTRDNGFVKDIEDIIDINEDKLTLDINVKFEPVTQHRTLRTYLSNSNFMHLYMFTVLVHGRGKGDKFEKLEKYFNEASLEFKISTIERTKKYAEYLDAIGFFYTDRPVAYELVTEEDINETDKEEIMGELEHVRWVEEKKAMGWTSGKAYENERFSNMNPPIRDLFRMNKLIADSYEELDKKEQDKDKEPLRELLSLLDTVDGIRIYKIPGRENR